MTARAPLFSVALLVAFLAGAMPAHAQSGLRPYVGGSLGSFSVSADDVEGRSVAGGIVGGLALSSTWTPNSRSPFQPTHSLGRTPASASRSLRRALHVRRSSDWAWSRASKGARRHRQPLGGRPHSPAGRQAPDAGGHRRRDQSPHEQPIVLYAGLDPGRRRPRTPRGCRPHRSLDAQHRRSDSRRESRHRPHASPVHRSRHTYDYGSIGDEINNTLRTSVRMHWRF